MGQDVLAPVRLLADVYGLDDRERAELPGVVAERRVVGERFLRGRVAAGEPEFLRRWAGPAGEARHDRDRRWLEEALPGLADRLAADAPAMPVPSRPGR